MVRIKPSPTLFGEAIALDGTMLRITRKVTYVIVDW